MELGTRRETILTRKELTEGSSGRKKFTVRRTLCKGTRGEVLISVRKGITRVS